MPRSSIAGVVLPFALVAGDVWPNAASAFPNAMHVSIVSETTSVAMEDPGDLYTIDLVSGHVSRLTTDPRLDGAPAWMPDGERLLFARLMSGTDPTSGNTDIFLIAADGSAEQQLTDDRASDVTPRSSPDGTSIVFTSERDGNPEIYVLVLATAEVRRLTNDPAGDRFPAYSRDGRTIVFTSDRDGDDDIYVMDASGSNVRRLTDSPGTDWLAEYSPDGSTIAFATDHSIDLMDADGGSRISLTPDAANHPSWSPDGRQIAAVTLSEDGDFAICTIDVATAAVTVITGAGADDFYPAWSPDGQTIAFTRVSGAR